ncbi:MAG TPA: MFS transporter [Solirubrobacteraceae bacterium]|jgi:predicted MFS family arabinose efflux permease
MTTIARLALRPAAAVRAGRLPPRVAFALQVSILVGLLAASSAPTPLYAVYQAAWGFSSITVTVVFGVYAVAVLAALLVVGGLSDHVGRRPVLLVAIGLQLVALLVFATAGGVLALLIARVVQGLSTGAAVAALGAGLLDLHRTRGAIANGVAPLLGTASGALVSGVLIQYLPAPTELVYLTLVAIFVIQGIGVALMSETSLRKPGALASLRPQIGVPDAARRPLLVAAPVLVAVWALGGFYASLGPSLARLVVGSDSHVLGGLALFALAGSASLTVALTRTLSPRAVMALGSVALATGVAITLLAVAQRSGIAFFAGTVVAGVGFGAGFQGGLRTVLPLAAAHERAGVLSIVYAVCYLAMGLPAVIGGVLVVHGGLLVTAREYGIAVIALAGLALLGMVGLRPREPVPAAAVRVCPCAARRVAQSTARG